MLKSLYLFFLGLAIFSCTKLEEPIAGTSNKVEISTINPVTKIGADSAFAGGTITKDGGEAISDRGVVWATSSNPTLSNFRRKLGSGTGSYSIQIDTLLPFTDYFVRAYAINYFGTFYGQQVAFKTIKGVPKFNSSNVIYFEAYLAKVSAFIVLDGGDPVSNRGFCFSKSPNPSLVNGTVIPVGKGTLYYEATLLNLSPNQKYYVRPYATNNIGTAYGKQVEFTTSVGPAKMGNIQVSSITSTSAKFDATILSAEGGNLSRRGFVISKNTEPFLYNATVIEQGNGIGSYSYTIQNLEKSTTYYLKAFGVNESGVSHTNQVMFSTLGYPNVSTNFASNLGYTNFTVLGTVNTDGGSPILERGFCLNTTGNPSVNENRIRVAGQLGSFQVEYNGLLAGRTYYYRAYAINEVGIAYGNVVSQDTRANTQPVITRTPALGTVSNRQINVTGYLDSDGGLEITNRGFLYSRSTSNPSWNDSRLQLSGGYEWSGTIGNLENGNVRYYVRSYAVNALGTALGPVSSFTTPSISIPIVRNGSASNIAARTATISGIVDSDGNGNITNTNFLLSTNANMAGASSYTGYNYSSSNNTFSTSLTGLSPNTNYYYQARASNQVGISSLPSASSFKTLCEQVSSSTTGYSLTTKGTIKLYNIYHNWSFPQNEQVEGGICYSSTNSIPTVGGSGTTNIIYVNQTVPADSGGSGTWIINLTVGTKYYVRIYWKNCFGISYSNILVL